MDKTRKGPTGLLQGRASFYDVENVSTVHTSIKRGARRHKPCFQRDKDYNRAQLRGRPSSNEFTGRMKCRPRRYSEGLAPGARGQLAPSRIQPENQTLGFDHLQELFFSACLLELAAMTFNPR